MKRLSKVFRGLLIPAALSVLVSTELIAQPQELGIGSMLPLQDHSVALAQTGAATTVGAMSGSRGTVVIFWSNTCEWTQGYASRVEALYEMGSHSGVSVYLVNSNDVSAFPEESGEASAAAGYPMPYLMDSDAALARAMGAVRAPHVFAFDANLGLVYYGAIDDAPADASDVQEAYLQSVIQALGSGLPMQVSPTRAFGCRIRYPGG